MPTEHTKKLGSIRFPMKVVALWILGLIITGAIGGLIGMQFGSDNNGWLGVVAGMLVFGCYAQVANL